MTPDSPAEPTPPAEPPRDEGQAVLSYDSGRPSAVPTSRLAVAAFAAAVFACPCVLQAVVRVVGFGLEVAGWRMPYLDLWFLATPMILAVVLAVAAVARVRAAAGAVRGGGLAVAALAMSVGWWGLAVAVVLYLRAAYAAPGR